MIKYITIGIFVGLFSCNHIEKKVTLSNEDNQKESLDTIIYHNYLNAVERESTFQFFLVIKIKDLNTGLSREVCTKGDFLEGALHL